MHLMLISDSVPHVYISREPVQHVEFDVQLLGNCDEVVVELARRAGWELKHEMADPKEAMKVEGVEEAGHWWVVRKEDEVPKGYDARNGAGSQNGSMDGVGVSNGFGHAKEAAEGAV